MMAYTFVGYLSPEESWIKVYRFDPCNGVGKPVIALKSCIFIDGKCASKAIDMEKFMFGLFEVVEQCETSKKYNYATIIRRVETYMDVVVPDVMPTEFQFVNRLFYGILLDYNKNTEMYLLGLGSLLCQLPFMNFRDFPYVTPELLSTSIVCVVVRTGTVYDQTANKIFINNIHVKCFKALTFWEDKYTNFTGQEQLKSLETKLVPTCSSEHGQQWLQPLVPVYFENPSFQRPFPAPPVPKLVTPWFIPQTWRHCQSLLPAFSPPSLVYPQSLPHISFPSPMSYSYPLAPKYDMSVKTNQNLFSPYSYPKSQHFVRPSVPKHKARSSQKVPVSSHLENQSSSCQSAENQPVECIHAQPQQFGHTSTSNVSTDPFPPSHLPESQLDTEPLLSKLECLLLRDTPSPNIFPHPQGCADIQSLSSQTTSMESTSLQLSPVNCSVSSCPSTCSFLAQSCLEETASTNACQQLSQTSPASPTLVSSYTQQQAARCLMRGLEFPTFHDVHSSFSSPGPVPSTSVCQDQQCSLCSSVPLSASADQRPERVVTPPNAILPCSHPQAQLGSQTAPDVQSPQTSSLTSLQSKDACVNCEECFASSGEVSTDPVTYKATDSTMETTDSSPSSASTQDCAGESGPEADDSCNCCELASLSLKELADLAPALTGHQRIYESYGMFEKPVITIG
ncbi:uncharacterized protein [Macrobrachium rosenbergii]|uniref:uncharacterized protein isoform X2 n=1 Tax=Macrobrachium rosenbergii TaxID=79674 RepID=UPI0034D4EAE1